MKGKIDKDITVVLDVGDVGDVLDLGGGDVRELGVSWDLRQQLIDNIRALSKLKLSLQEVGDGGPKCRYT